MTIRDLSILIDLSIFVLAKNLNLSTYSVTSNTCRELTREDSFRQL